MVDREIVRTKIARIEHHVRRLREKQSVPLEAFRANEDIQDIVLRNLQNGIQGCLDLASHLVGDEGWKVPSTQAGLFQTLSDHKVITQDEADRMKAMVGFRNLIVHEYAEVNFEKVYDILIHHLDDFTHFCRQVIRHAGL